MTEDNATLSKLPPLKKVLIVGRGGRENALAWAISKSEEIKKVYIAPGNGGSENHLSCQRLNIEESDSEKLIQACKEFNVDLVVIGPEQPLSFGLADHLREAGLAVFGPGKKGAQLEASKSWAKELMIEFNIPTAQYWQAKNKNEALTILSNQNTALVVKADGLASGKGVSVCSSINETKEAINDVFEGKFGKAGTQIVLEECLEGPEISIFAISDGEGLTILPPAQDHKRLLDGDKGPNTGGMGAYAPAQILGPEDLKEVTNLLDKNVIS